jgi:hypothetical protein
MLPIYESLMALDPAPRILVFSGDVDGCVPHLGTRRWVSSLGLHTVQAWRSWHSGTGEHTVMLAKPLTLNKFSAPVSELLCSPDFRP